MTDSRQTDVGQLIGSGVSLMHDLMQAPHHLLDLAFNDDFLRRKLQLHHVGLLVSRCSDAEMVSSIEAHGLQVLSVFPSSVVATQLSKQFGKPVKIDISRTCSSSGGVQTLELFRVVDGLETHEVAAVMPDILHIAYVPTESVDVETLCTKMAADGFDYIGGGINYQDVTADSGENTVLYFLNRQLLKDVPKIELVLPGTHAIPSIREDAVSFSASSPIGDRL